MERLRPGLCFSLYAEAFDTFISTFHAKIHISSKYFATKWPPCPPPPVPTPMLPLDLPTGQDGATGHACRHASRSDALRECSLSLCRLSAVNSSKFVVGMLFPVVLRSCRKNRKQFAMCSEILRLESDKESCVPPRDAIQNVYSHCVGCRRPITIQLQYVISSDVPVIQRKFR